MQLDEVTLKQCVEWKPVGNRYPYNTDDEREIENFLKRFVGELRASQLILVDADFDHYGSGYASYVDVFCYRKDGSSTIQHGDTAWIEGIMLYLCRLAPVAVYGGDKRMKSRKGSSRGFLKPERVGTLPTGEWTEVIHEISKKLTKFGFDLLRQEDVSSLLTFDTEIPTILNNGAYRVFDALFYWTD